MQNNDVTAKGGRAGTKRGARTGFAPRLGIPINPHDLESVAMRSATMTRARQSIYAVDDAMRANYDLLKQAVATSVRPVIVVQNDLVGGTYTLLEHDRSTTVQPVPPLFQMVKSVSHAPLAIYSIVAPYLNSSVTTAWRPALQSFGAVVETALDQLTDADLPSLALQSCRAILEGSRTFIEERLLASRVTVTDFKQYTGALEKAIVTNLEIAAEAQVTAIQRQLRVWRKHLGSSWSQLYAVVLVIWTTELDNQNELILRTEMDPGTVDDHLIVLSTASMTEDTVDAALLNLGQIVQDNVAAALVFSNEDALDTLLGKNLKGPQDLLAWSIKNVLKSCPHANKYSVPEPER
jgi:hypothetical protein